MESAGNSNQKRGQRNGWTNPGVNGQLGGSGPGERSTELVLAQDKGFMEKDNGQY